MPKGVCMKKFFTALFCAILVLALAVGVSACGKTAESVKVYMPDGAPALSAARLMAEDKFDREVEYEVVDASLISTFVTGENPAADLCILPVNAASKLLGKGDKYKLVGTVTHGNLFILTKNGENLTKENLASLKGKTVGVINLAAVPGLTFKIILKDNGVEYSDLGNGGDISADKVNLKAVTAGTLTGCDYYVVPEPAASTLSKKMGLNFAGDLQALYGGDAGYPQAVLVAKNSLIESSPEFISKFTAAMSDNSTWILSETTSAESIISAISKHLTSGLSPTFTAANLTKSVIKNCAIKFTAASDCKEEVTSFIAKLISVEPTSAATPSNDFFYTGK